MASQTRAYFDCNATTPTLPVAAQAALEAMNTLFGNPSSAHLVGMQAKHILESTRKLAAQAVGAKPEQIVFTSGATEAIQTAIFSVLTSAKQLLQQEPKRRKILFGATEHKAVPQALSHWVKALSLPIEIIELPVSSKGLIELDALRALLPETLMLCTMAVNNETGVIQNLAGIEKLLLETSSPLLWLVDCVQALGKQALALRSSRVDYAAFSGHKLYAPKGIGFLYASERAQITPLIVGGGQERGLRSGTENLPGVAALGAVLKTLLEGGKPFASHEKLFQSRDRIVAELRRAFPKVEFNTPFENSVPTTINFSVPGFSSLELMDLFDSAGLRLSAGSACSAASPEPSYVLAAMDLPEWRTVSALRLSFGPATSDAEIDRGCRVIRESALALQHSCLLGEGGIEVSEDLRDGILQLRSGPSNTWILADRETRSCVVIDPVDAIAERLEHYIRCQNLRVVAILDTHSHADHVSVRPVLQKLLEDQMVSHAADPLGWPDSAPNSLIETLTLDGGAKVPALRISGDRMIARLHTPGHTDDSHAFLYGVVRDGVMRAADVLFAFSGDTILTGGLGRTNFAMSDTQALFSSLRKLGKVLGSTTLLCPAHDYQNSFATRLSVETEENGILNLALAPANDEQARLNLDPFVRKKKEIDTALENIERSFHGIVCGVSSATTGDEDSQIVLSQARLKEVLKSEPLIIDVREPQEHELSKNWKALGFNSPPRNVPLSRFVNFMRELMVDAPAGRDVILFCRSGSRSLQAARSLRRLGISRAYTLEGGVSLLGS